MSVVIGYKANNRVYIGADCCTISRGFKNISTNVNNAKIHRYSNGIIIGSVGRVRDFDVVKTMKFNFDGNLDYKYMVRCLVPKIISELIEFGYVDDSEGFEKMESSFVVAYQDKLFCISSDGSIREVDDNVSIGCGDAEAFGSIYTNKSVEPEEIIVEAIRAASYHDPDISMPAILMNTLTDEVKIVE